MYQTWMLFFVCVVCVSAIPPHAATASQRTEIQAAAAPPTSPATSILLPWFPPWLPVSGCSKSTQFIFKRSRWRHTVIYMTITLCVNGLSRWKQLREKKPQQTNVMFLISIDCAGQCFLCLQQQSARPSASTWMWMMWRWKTMRWVQGGKMPQRAQKSIRMH